MKALPKFEGRVPDKQVVALTGKAELHPSQWAARKLDEIVYTLTATKVAKVSHDLDKDDDLSRVETRVIARLADMDTNEGAELMAKLQNEARQDALDV